MYNKDKKKLAAQLSLTLDIRAERAKSAAYFESLPEDERMAAKIIESDARRKLSRFEINEDGEIITR